MTPNPIFVAGRCIKSWGKVVRLCKKKKKKIDRNKIQVWKTNNLTICNWENW